MARFRVLQNDRPIGIQKKHWRTIAMNISYYFGHQKFRNFYFFILLQVVLIITLNSFG
jgi:hypothetical protein